MVVLVIVTMMSCVDGRKPVDGKNPIDRNQGTPTTAPPESGIGVETAYQQWPSGLRRVHGRFLVLDKTDGLVLVVHNFGTGGCEGLSSLWLFSVGRLGEGSSASPVVIRLAELHRMDSEVVVGSRQGSVEATLHPTHSGWVEIPLTSLLAEARGTEDANLALEVVAPSDDAVWYFRSPAARENSPRLIPTKDC